MLAKLLYTLGCSILLVVLISCTKQVEIKPLPPSVEEEYLTSKHEIDKMLDALNNHDVPNDEKREILCKTYPEVYKNHYIPALLKLSPHQYSEEVLLRDFEAVIKFYKQAWSIKCI
ncbi:MULTISPECIES: hypothetical protein [Acinetobacter calcoaceticus/baumannii complex]|nr:MULTISPECIES: hypothetical protein [Acinetobacter calcoaceticus/baumannii complex]KCY47769.1 hypothetical protein J715_3373 [Acinetobacter baumannii 1571545]AUT36875.1 hypothetical protein C2U32_02100 [Acinetobacter baumannii]EXH77380.1 hypothetical protein J633_1360 [Acinetobacter sp. 216872]MBJ9727067.1 hypothetical protein [Acinetobacter nosocomialis]MBU3118640.1 hypothetical protein [Acinetobacter nosocomialis]